VLEVMIDDALADGPWRATLRRLGAKWPLVAHGTELGVAGADRPSPAYLTAVGQALAALHARWYSEHLAFVRGGGIELGHFVPPFDDDAALAALARNAADVRASWRGPFLLENAADVLGLGGGGEAAGPARGLAYKKALEAADAGALLDLTNLVLDARNDGFDPGGYLAAIPLERVVEVHLAGGRHDGALWIDSHDHDVDGEALDLLAEVGRRAPHLRAVIVERDQRLPDLDALLGELDRVREVLGRAGRA
jgi:uncharacterized protein